MTPASRESSPEVITSLKSRSDERERMRLLMDALDKLASDDKATGRLVDMSGNETEIPASAVEAFRVVVRGMASGETISVIPLGRDMTTQQVADLLHVSRPHVVALVERGEIPHHMVGAHRRIRAEDALEYRSARNRSRRAALDKLTKLAEESDGGYE